MTSWFKHITPKLIKSGNKKDIPANVWTQCPECKETLYGKDLDRNNKVCPKCNYYYRLSVEERIELLTDAGGWVEFDSNMTAKDPLRFVDTKRYKDRMKATVSKTGTKEALVYGEGRMNGQRVSMAIFNYKFMGGSMGSVVGEKITRAAEHSLKERIPLLVVSASGGARMQEGALSLMQMAKTSAALAKLSEERIPFISLLTDPTTGGVSASFAMLGDLNIVEPNALVGFAGPRVIKQTIGEELPVGFQRAEFLLEHGAVDQIVPRENQKEKISQLFAFMSGAL